jgi:aquaporin Z
MSSSFQSISTAPTVDLTLGRTVRSDQRPSHPLRPRLLAEFIGTFFLVFTDLTAIDPQTGAGPLAPLAIGSTLMVTVFATGPISGGHLNPAISLAVLIRGKLTIADWIRYTLTQLTAGPIGSLVALAVAGAASPPRRRTAGRSSS